MYADIYARSVSQVPKGEHWVILRRGCGDLSGYGTNDEFLYYDIYLTEEKFLKAYGEALKDTYARYQVLGIHVSHTYKGETSIKIEKG